MKTDMIEFRHWRYRWICLMVAVGVCLATSISISAQQLSKRLILKDGSYQLATRWEIKGDRVRYLSAERNVWEEVPEELVDWKATSKFEQDRATGAPNPEAVEVDKELAAEHAEQEAKTPQVAPGLHLPDSAPFLLLDTFQNQPQLVELQQNGGEVNRNRGQNMVRAMIIPIPITSSKQTIEIEGLHATVQAHTTLPSIYINLSFEQGLADSNAPPQGTQRPQQPQQPEQPWDRFHIVHAKAKDGKRIVGVIKVNPLGKATQTQNLVTTTCQQLSGDWVKVTPSTALEPGEYAVVELLGHDGMNTYVWDFGVNPAAPANAGAVKAAAAAIPAAADKQQPH